MRARRHRPLQYLLEPRPRLSDGRTPIPVPARMQGRLPLLTSNRSSPQREPRLSIVCARGWSRETRAVPDLDVPREAPPCLSRRSAYRRSAGNLMRLAPR